MRPYERTPNSAGAGNGSYGAEAKMPVPGGRTKCVCRWGMGCTMVKQHGQCEAYHPQAVGASKSVPHLKMWH